MGWSTGYPLENLKGAYLGTDPVAFSCCTPKNMRKIYYWTKPSSSDPARCFSPKQIALQAAQSQCVTWKCGGPKSSPSESEGCVSSNSDSETSRFCRKGRSPWGWARPASETLTSHMLMGNGVSDPNLLWFIVENDVEFRPLHMYNCQDPFM